MLLLQPLLLLPLLENGTTCDKISLAATPPPPKATPTLLVFWSWGDLKRGSVTKNLSLRWSGNVLQWRTKITGPSSLKTSTLHIHSVMAASDQLQLSSRVMSSNLLNPWGSDLTSLMSLWSLTMASWGLRLSRQLTTKKWFSNTMNAVDDVKDKSQIWREKRIVGTKAANAKGKGLVLQHLWKTPGEKT